MPIYVNTQPAEIYVPVYYGEGEISPWQPNPAYRKFGPFVPQPGLALDLANALYWANERAKSIVPVAQPDGEGGYYPAMTLTQLGMGTNDEYRAAVFGSFGAAGSMNPWDMAELLDNIAAGSGCPVFDWMPYFALAAKQYADSTAAQFGRPMSFLYKETPFAYPIHEALARAAKDCPALATAVVNTAPGTEFWTKAQAMAWEFGKASNRAQIMSMFTVIAIVAAPLLMPAAGATGGAAASAGTTATVEGAELAALVEAGTVGAEGAFLEAAALTGSSVSYSTATGAVIEAVTPAGTTIGFDASVDAYSQFGIQPAQVADAVQLPEPLEVAEQPATQSQTTTYADKLQQQVVKMAEGGIKSAIVNELREAITGEPSQFPAQLAPGQGVAQPGKLGDIAPVLALGIVAGAFALRKVRGKR